MQSVLDFDPSVPGNQGTLDEESSGIIDIAPILGEGFYLLDVQAHYAINAANPRGFANPNELVQGGQLLVMRAGATAGVGFDATTNGPALVVHGTQRSDEIEVETEGAALEVEVNDRTLGEFTNAVDRILVAAYNGHDEIDLSDVLLGTRIYGGRGNDIILGGMGSDLVHAGAGNDLVFGGLGSDDLRGDDGTDLLFGGAGDDKLDGGNGIDLLFGGAGIDQFMNGEIVVQ